MGDAIAISLMIQKKFSKLDFKKFHPSGNLSKKLRTVEDLMFTGKKIPFIDENSNMEKVIKLINLKKLGVAIIRNKKKETIGIFTDGDIKRTIQKSNNLKKQKIKSFMVKNPISINKDVLAENALELMNRKKITSLCVHKDTNKRRTLGVLHIHTLLNSDIT